MANLSGLISGFFTDIDVVDSIAINGDIGTANQVLTSDGTKTSYQNPTVPAASALVDAGTGITITTTGNPETIATNVKSLVLSGTAVVSTPQTFNPNANGGSQTITINDTNNQLSLAEGSGITITNLGGFNRRIAAKIDADTIVFDGTTMEVAKVPNALTAGTNISFSSGTTYDGSGAITISSADTNTTYTGGDGIEISGANVISATIDGETIVMDGADLSVAKVPEFLTAGTNVSFSSGTTYDGSGAITISATDTNTTYTAGTNLNLSSTTFNLDTVIEDQVDLEFLANGTATTIVGSDYPSKPTVCSYLDLSSSTNILPSVDSPFLATKIQATYLSKSIGTAYTEYSSNFRTSFVAQSANALVEFQAVIAAYSKVMYGGLYDYIAGSFWTTPQTQTRFKYDNGVDQDPTTLYWYLTGLTAGTTYYISPYFKSSANYTYIYAGNSGTANSFAPGIFRISDGGSNVSVH